MTKENYYDILGVDKTSSPEELKKAFRKLSLKHHPDKGGDSDMFKKINNAYSVLSNPEKKKAYDMFGDEDGPKGMPGGQVNPDEIFKHFFGGQNGPGGSGMGVSPFDFIFSQMGNMGNMGGQQGPNIRIFHNGRPVNVQQQLSKPVPIFKSIEISLQEAYTGKSQPLEIERSIIDENNMKTIEKETIYITIPNGIDNNELIILREKGHQQMYSNNRELKGDIKVSIKIKNDTKFVRKGLDLHLEHTISLKEALCGFTFNLDFLNGKSFTLNNKNNVIEPGTSKVLHNLGMKRENKTGSLIIKFNISFPKNLPEEKIQKLSELL